MGQIVPFTSLLQLTFGIKVIIHKSSHEVSLVEQDTIENVLLAYSKSLKRFKKKNQFRFMQLFRADAATFKRFFFVSDYNKKDDLKSCS